MKPVPYTLRRAVSEAVTSCGLSMSQGIPTGKSSLGGPWGYGQWAYLGNAIRSDNKTVISYETTDTNGLLYSGI